MSHSSKLTTSYCKHVVELLAMAKMVLTKKLLIMYILVTMELVEVMAMLEAKEEVVAMLFTGT